MSEPERPGALLPVLLAWVVPGAGHLKLGRVWPGVFVAGAVLPLFVLGMALAGYENVSFDRHPWYFALHVGAALPTALAHFLTEGRQLTEVMPHYKTGELYTAVAGLLNIVAAVDCWARCRRGDPEELARAREQAARGLHPEDLVEGRESEATADV